MPSSDAVVLEARSWVGTPYRHQGRIKGHAVDCVGLIVEAGLESGVLELTRQEFLARWHRFKGYGRLPRPLLVRQALELFMRPVIYPEHGDVAFVRWDRGPPMHLVMLATDRDYPTIIHAHGQADRCAEHSFGGEWPSRVDTWWRYPALMR